jgi:metallo-beta-lactamase family protein
MRVGGKDGQTILFGGDLGRYGRPVLPDPAPVDGADILLLESTYGDRLHEPDDDGEQLAGVINEAVGRGGKIIVPAFAIGRVEEVLYWIKRLEDAKRIPVLPVFVDSPMAVRATEVFRAHPECFDTDAEKLVAEHPELFGAAGWVRYVEKVHESIALNDRPGPCVIISASGMCESGRILHHLKHTIDNPANTILIAELKKQKLRLKEEIVQLQ